jgi:hypothetical protein
MFKVVGDAQALVRLSCVRLIEMSDSLSEREVQLPLCRLLANHMLITCWRLDAPERLGYPASVTLKPT